jgi:copper homeostasis protein
MTMVEVIAVCVEDAVRIAEGGAQRIELVSALEEGGLTPSYGLIKEVVQAVDIPVNVMIRPHSKSFVYTEYDLRIMKEDIKKVKELNANGIVLGILDENNRIDEKALNELLTDIDGLEVTFHKAIDDVPDLPDAVRILKKYPSISRILTSGGKGKIIDNIENIRRMVNAAGEQIAILLGGGLTCDNMETVARQTQVLEVHFGTGVREGNCVNGAIDVGAVRALVSKI